jgi:hypothetical protein
MPRHLSPTKDLPSVRRLKELAGDPHMSISDLARHLAPIGVKNPQTVVNWNARDGVSKQVAQRAQGEWNWSSEYILNGTGDPRVGDDKFAPHTSEDELFEAARLAERVGWPIPPRREARQFYRLMWRTIVAARKGWSHDEPESDS